MKFIFSLTDRNRLTKAFFKTQTAPCHMEDVFLCCVYARSTSSEQTSLSLADFKNQSPTFISNITVNDWNITGNGSGDNHHLIAFSPYDVKVIGKYVDEDGEPLEVPNFKDLFSPNHMTLSSAAAISGAVVSFDLGKYKSKFDMFVGLLYLLGIGMGNEKVSKPDAEVKRDWRSKVCYFHCDSHVFPMFDFVPSFDIIRLNSTSTKYQISLRLYGA